MKKHFQSYRGTWAWLIQRFSAIGLFFLIPLKIYSGWAARDKVPYPEFMGSSRKLHFDATIDIVLLLLFLLHAFYGLRVILIDVGVIREESYFWRTFVLSLMLFAGVVWYVYIHEY
jgi:succinate dehydrogenase / fumarate reductase cytochrome b subunit